MFVFFAEKTRNGDASIGVDNVSNFAVNIDGGGDGLMRNKALSLEERQKSEQVS